MSISVCNAVSRTQSTQNPCHARYVARRIEAFGRAMGRPFAFSGNGGTAIDADAPSLIALAKQMEFGV